jgi:hypothetical protein
MIDMADSSIFKDVPSLRDSAPSMPSRTFWMKSTNFGDDVCYDTIAVLLPKVYVQSMPFARKLILHAPVSNEALLERFVETCLAERVSLLAIFGPASDALEEQIDWLVIGNGSQPNRFLCTSSHPNEPLDEVLMMVDAWDDGEGGAIQQVHL